MKYFTCIFITLLLACKAHSQVLPASTNFAYIDINYDSLSDFQYYAFVIGQDGDISVDTTLIPSTGVEFLEIQRLNPFFDETQTVDRFKNVFTNTSGQNNIPFTRYLALSDRELGFWSYLDGGLKLGAGKRLEAYFGIRLTLDGAIHHCWIRFTRPDALPETLFTVAEHDWNPVPGAPIRVGQPPEIPITTEALPDGTGIRLSWPPAISNWILESTRSLSPPVTWDPFPSGGSYADVGPEEAGRYFRLRKPE